MWVTPSQAEVGFAPVQSPQAAGIQAATQEQLGEAMPGRQGPGAAESPTSGVTEVGPKASPGHGDTNHWPTLPPRSWHSPALRRPAGVFSRPRETSAYTACELNEAAPCTRLELGPERLMHYLCRGT